MESSMIEKVARADSRLCSVSGCDNPLVVARNLCDKHYRRWRRHGNPLSGGASPGEAMEFLQSEVMQYEGDDCLLWPFLRSEAGYAIIPVNRANRQVHRLVCEKVNGPPPSDVHQAAHECGKGKLGCVTKRHLSWKTPKENQADRLIHGTDGRGIRNASAKLTEDDVRNIRSLRGEKRAMAIAEQYKIATSNVYLIWNRERWGWLD